MRILIVHNHYQQAGGEDEVFRAETALLREHGHAVVTLTIQNSPVSGLGALGAARDAFWSRAFRRTLARAIEESRPDVAHFHNTFFRVSPSAYDACRQAGIPVVQSLHNYRLVCPGATLYRDGAACEDCLGGNVLTRSVRHACYRGSRAETAVVAGMLTAHRWLGTWQRSVDCYIAMTEFARETFIEGGLPAEKITIKPNFASVDPGRGDGRGRYALFVGRLSAEKGIGTLMTAWRALPRRVPLLIAGDGPLASRVADFTRTTPGCQWLGQQSRQSIARLMQDAAFLVVPSECYEMFPLVIAEAYAAGLPVIGSSHGSVGALIDDGRTGRHVRAGNPADVAAVVTWAATHPAELADMRAQARAEFEAKYTAERNYKTLIDIYDQTRSAAIR